LRQYSLIEIKFKSLLIIKFKMSERIFMLTNKQYFRRFLGIGLIGGGSFIGI
jgi:hypothetical protein